MTLNLRDLAGERVSTPKESAHIRNGQSIVNLVKHITYTT